MLIFIIKYSPWVVFLLWYNVLIAVSCEAPQTIMDVALYEIKCYYDVIYYNTIYNFLQIIVILIIIFLLLFINN